MLEKILLVEDDESIRAMVVDFLTKEGFDVSVAIDGQAAIDQLRESTYSLVLLDLMLPKKSGIDVLRFIREQSYLPVIILSAKESDADKTIALELGADDYITKPFSLIELMARIRATIRRSTIYSNKSLQEELILRHAHIQMNPSQHEVTSNGLPLKLTSKEYDILKLFLEYPRKVFTKEDVYEAIWKEAYFGDENIVNVHMSRLREKIELDSKHPQIIETLWGIGYRLKKGE